MDEVHEWTSVVYSITGEETVFESAKLMTKNKISSLVIVSDYKPIGIITERDIVKAITEEKDLKNIKVTEVMTSEPVTLKNTDPIKSAKKTMLEKGFRHMPVVDGYGNLVGILSLRDILKSG